MAYFKEGLLVSKARKGPSQLEYQDDEEIDLGNDPLTDPTKEIEDVLDMMKYD